MGKILRIDLTSGKNSLEEVAQADEQNYLGGAGVAAAILTREVPPTLDAFDPKNLLIISVGPFCGTAVPFCGRHFVMAKSPLTGMIGEASAGGFFGRELKGAGFDQIVIMGKSPKPVYLWIKDQTVELRDATELWGKTTSQTEAAIQEKLGDKTVKIASIGPAGENLVRFASIMSEENRAAGRCGLGAVMGSKNPKAIAVKGTSPIQ